jgi:hypothetical protein
MSKKTEHFSIAEITWLRLFREITAVYSENHTKPINKYILWGKCRVLIVVADITCSCHRALKG